MIDPNETARPDPALAAANAALDEEKQRQAAEGAGSLGDVAELAGDVLTSGVGDLVGDAVGAVVEGAGAVIGGAVEIAGAILGGLIDS